MKVHRIIYEKFYNVLVNHFVDNTLVGNERLNQFGKPIKLEGEKIWKIKRDSLNGCVASVFILQDRSRRAISYYRYLRNYNSPTEEEKGNVINKYQKIPEIYITNALKYLGYNLDDIDTEVFSKIYNQPRIFKTLEAEILLSLFAIDYNLDVKYLVSEFWDFEKKVVIRNDINKELELSSTNVFTTYVSDVTNKDNNEHYIQIFQLQIKNFLNDYLKNISHKEFNIASAKWSDESREKFKRFGLDYFPVIYKNSFSFDKMTCWDFKFDISDSGNIFVSCNWYFQENALVPPDFNSANFKEYSVWENKHTNAPGVLSTIFEYYRKGLRNTNSISTKTHTEFPEFITITQKKLGPLIGPETLKDRIKRLETVFEIHTTNLELHNYSRMTIVNLERINNNWFINEISPVKINERFSEFIY